MRNLVMANPAAIAQRILRAMGSRAKVLWLGAINRYSRSQIVQPGGPVVSVTSYGHRVRSVYLAIESIGAGSVKPSRCILWLDEQKVLQNLPKELVALRRRGLEVRLCQNYGPHTKYYPYLDSVDECVVPLVTADDDVLYPRYWLESLVDAYREFPDAVNCHRARVITTTQNGLAKYQFWQHAASIVPSPKNFALGIGGVIYPPRLQERLKREGTAFLECCPKADDIWLHLQALRAGLSIRQIAPKAFDPVIIPGSQSNALNHSNLAGGENDRQIENTYGTAEIDLLRASQREDAV
jgi:hypothetical protein